MKRCLILIGLTVLIGCEDTIRPQSEAFNKEKDSAGGNQNGNDPNGSDDYTFYDEEDCDSLLEITVRDFDESHPDMQRADPGWGPLAGVLELTLGPDRKPVFYDVWGTHTWKTYVEDGVLEKNCWDSGPGTEEICYAGDIPMFDGPESFHDWYHDTNYNQRFDKQIQMVASTDEPGVYIYDTDAFFPLAPNEGFGATPPNDNPNGDNFLFTTEIHLLFTYVKGQKFTFRGDDDLWIFVNNKMALDIGGMHLPFEGTIDFDAMAEELGIVPGTNYNMDIFHAERHTSQSNFRIETNIACFMPVLV
jgi:fibro-slime domain-containing protein